MLYTDKLSFFRDIELVRFIFPKKTFEVYGLKYDRHIQNSGNIVYFGHVRFPAVLGKISKLQQ